MEKFWVFEFASTSRSCALMIDPDGHHRLGRVVVAHDRERPADAGGVATVVQLLLAFCLRRRPGRNASGLPLTKHRIEQIWKVSDEIPRLHVGRALDAHV